MVHRSGVKCQNYELKHPLVPKRSWFKRLLRRPIRYYHPSVGYYEHMPAWRVRAYLGDEIWNQYYKFSFERNPWDRQVSFYHYRCRDRGKQMSFEQFLEKRRRSFVDNWGIYTINNQCSVDFLGRFEYLVNDFNLVKKELGLPNSINIPTVNKSSKAANYKEYYTDVTRQLIAEWYSSEIEMCGYKFE